MKKIIALTILVAALIATILTLSPQVIFAETEMEFFSSLRMARPGDMLSLEDVRKSNYGMNDLANGYYAEIMVSDGHETAVTQVGFLLHGEGWQLGQFGAVLTLENGATIIGEQTHFKDGILIEFPLTEKITGRYEAYLSIGKVPSGDYMLVNLVNGHGAGGTTKTSSYDRTGNYGNELLPPPPGREDPNPIINAPEDSVFSQIAIVNGEVILNRWPDFWNPFSDKTEAIKTESTRKYPLIADPVFSSLAIDHTTENVGPKKTLIDGDGNIHCLYGLTDNIVIKVFDRNLSEIKALTIPKLMPIFGAATMDDKGFYYIAFGKNLYDEELKNEQNVAVAKYDNNGKFQGSTYFVAGEGYFNGTKMPFDRNSAMIISGNVLAVHFSRTMFKSGDGLNHQSSTVLYVDIDQMTPVSLPIPYTSHSFAQAAVTTSDGGFLFADRGDGYPRGFKITTVSWMGEHGITPFHFRELNPYQQTNSSLAGIAETASGYLLAGTSERVLSNVTISSTVGGPQDLFIQLIDKEFFIKEQRQDTIVSKGETRRTEGIQNTTGLNYEGGSSSFLAADTVDYGVVWLTAYPAKQHAYNPVLVVQDDGFILLWERHEQQEYSHYAYQDTWYMVLSSDCLVIKPATKIAGNPRTESVNSISYSGGKVYWLGTQYLHGAMEISLQSLTILDKPSSWAIGQVEVAVDIGLVPSALQSGYQHAITRAEFCNLAVQLYEKHFGKEITGRVSFADTNDVNVQKMAAIGVVSGISETVFDPHSKLTREQAASILVRLAKACDLPLAKATVDFNDHTSIGTWAVESVGQVQAAGLMGGTGNGNFSPKDPYTREQSIITLMRLYELIRK
ncbi:MAG: S-layer homology domain-containing protein [Symbiobacteriaceae bacterium]|nr:S-layer homology domain-containing protein [Symbiobacteriaceae bacterium]